MKLNDDMDLVPLDVTNQCVRSIWNSGTGAGANANSWSMVDMLTFVGPDRLTELVWSQNGLGIKCFPDRKTCFLRDVGPSIGCTEDEKRASQGHSGASRATSQVDDGFGKCCSSVKTRSMTTGNLADTGEGSQNQIKTDVLPQKTFEDGMSNCGGKIEDIIAVTQERSLPNLESSEKKNVEKGKDKMKEDDLSNTPSLEKLEAMAENDVKDLVAKDHIFNNEGRNPQVDLVPSEKSLCFFNEKHEDDSHGSMDSCNSVSLKPKGKRKWSFDERLIVGSKRIKKQNQDFTYLKPVIKQDSSFMNWISNMVKGLDKRNQEDDYDQNIGVFEKPQIKKLGFQSVFRSLYSNNANPHEITYTEDKAIATRGSCDDQNDILKQTPFGNDDQNDILMQTPFGNDDQNDILKQTPFGNDDQNDILKQTPFGYEENTPICALENDRMSSFDCSNGVKTSNYLGSLWVTRLYPKTRNLEAKSLQNADASASFGLKKIDEIPKQVASGSGKDKLMILEAPKGMFDSIRRLRLSRTDILKWANSQLSPEHLHGFFLRLRLAKCEDGAGGAGYYVACITGLQGEKASKKCIHVNVGGVKCLIESQHISNRDFLEEELASWWQKTTRSESGGVRMEKDLLSKLEERKKLGF